MTFKDVLRYKNTDWPTDVSTSPGHVTVGEVLCLVACSCCDVCYHGNITQEQLHLCRRETSRVDGLWHWGNAINSLGGNSMHWGGARYAVLGTRCSIDVLLWIHIGQAVSRLLQLIRPHKQFAAPKFHFLRSQVTRQTTSHHPTDL